MINDELEVPMETEVETTTEVNSEPGVAADETASSTVSEENVNTDEKANQGHREYTPEERASYSFRKQLNKQKAKYEGQYNNLQAQYNELLERLNRLENPDKYAPLNRGQFQDDDSYIDALVQQRFDNMWNQRLQEAQQRYQEQAQQDQEVQAYKSRQDENVKKLFKTPEAEKQYRETIGIALQNGLGDLIDSDKEIAQYIMRSDMGPKILYEMAMKPDIVSEMFSDNVTPMDRQFKIRELENNLRASMVTPAPVIGKPGIKSQASAGSIFDSDESILNYLRTH
jgi:hypothetical protein